ncbi:EpsG family protein [Morganella morganii]|nr:EpsG family protein [Morganella morganii]HCR3197719.1 EpsG family protein [Morganella morganii]
MLYTYIVYNVVLLSGSFFAYLSDKAKNKFSINIFYLISFLSVLSVLILRYNVGTDYNSYEYIYYHIKEDENYLEPGFIFLLKLCQQYSLSSEVFIGVFSLISTSFIYLTARHYNKLIFITFYILVLYFQNMTAIRQITAVCIALYALHFLIQRKNVTFIIFIVLSSLFHSSTLLLLPFILCNNIQFNKKSYLPFVLAIIASAIYLDIFNIISELNILQGTKYQSYLISKFNTPTQLGSGLGVILKTVPPLLFSIYFFNKEKYIHNLLYVLNIAYIVAIILSAKVHIFNRLPPIFCIVVPYSLYFMSNHHRTLKYILMITFIFLIFFENDIRISDKSLNKGLGITPYTSIFEK